MTVGDTLSYQITVTAPGTNPLIVNTIVDALPAGLRASASPAVLVNSSNVCGAAGFGCSAGLVTDPTGALVSQVQISSVNASPSGYALPAGQSITFTVPVVYTGGGTGVGGIGLQDRACRTLANTAKLYDNYAGTGGNAPRASSVVNATGCGAGLGLEPWWSYLRSSVGVASDAAVNVANGNLVVTATDGNPIQGRGHLAQVTRRAYNSQDTTLETLPGSIGKGWQLNLGMSDALADTGVTGTALRIPTVADAASLVTGPLGVTLVDRDGTRHTFTPRLLSLSGITGGFAGTAMSLANLPAALGTVTPQVLSVPTGRVGCVDVAYDPPAGVHLALWRYVAVVSSNSSCDRATWTQSGTNAPVALGYVAIRPDRLRTEYDATGQLLALTDQAGVSLHYSWNNLHQLTSVTEAFCSSNCRTTSFSYTAGNGSPATSNADLTTLAGVLGRAVTLNDIASMTITDPAHRTSSYTFTTSTLGGAYPAGVRLLSTVVNDSGTGGAYDQVSYGYQSDSTGASCSASPGQLCTITDERGHTTNYGYDAGTATAPLLGPARISNIHDRRRDSHTGGGYGTFLAYSDRTSSPGSGTTVTLLASGNGATPANSNREAFYGNIDASGRVGQLLEGPQPISTSTALRNTMYTWDSDSSQCGVSHTDNDLCSLTRVGSAAPSGSDGAATPDEVTSWRYDDAGQVLQSSQTLTPTTSLVTTHGYARQWGYADGTVSSISVESDAPNSSTATASNSLLALYTLADLTSTVTPRGNANAAALAASYRTSYVVDNLPGAAPATAQSGQTCSSSGTATGNTGLVCAASAPYTGSAGPSLAVTKNTYDSYGELTSRMDPNGHATIFDYYGDGTTDMSGTAGAAGWLKTVIDPTGAFVVFGYDAAGNVIRSWDRTATTDAGLGSSSYPGSTSYLPTGNQGVVPHSDTRHGSGSFAAAAAHPWRWVIASSDNLGNTTTLTRDASGDVTRRTDARGNSTDTSYDEVGNLVSVLTPTNAALSPQAYELYSYDAFGEQISSTDPARAQAANATPAEVDRTSNVTSRTYYDPLGRATDTYALRQTGTTATGSGGCLNTSGAGGLGDPMLPASAIVCGNHAVYDSVDNLVWTRDPSGAATSRSYDAVHRLVKVISPAVNTTAVSGTDLSRPVAGYIYDADGNTTTVCHPRQSSEYGGTCSDTATGDVTHTSYDAANRPQAVTSYRTTSQPITSTRVYDANGNVVRTVDGNGRLVTYYYDYLNRITRRVWQRSASVSVGDATFYDPSGSVIGVLPPTNSASATRLTGMRTDADHRTIDTVTGLQVSLPWIEQNADASNRAGIRSVINPALDANTASGTSNTRTRHVYDAVGNVVANYAPRAFTASVPSHSDNSNGANSNAAGGFSSLYMTRINYDADNRPVASWTARSGGTTTDPLAGSLTGNEAAQCSAAGPSDAGMPAYPGSPGLCRTSATYDPDGRVSTITLPTATATRTARQITRSYSPDGLLLTVTAPAASDTTTSGSTPGATASTTMTYDGAGRLLTSIDPLNLTTTASYSPAGTQVRLDPPTGPNGMNRWTETGYNLDGQPNLSVTPRTETGTPGPTPGETDTTSALYTADGLVSDLLQPGASSTVSRRTIYGYDNNSNTTRVLSPGGNAKDANNTTGAATTLAYTFDNLLLSSTVPVNPDNSKARTVSYGYDTAGRLISTAVSTTTTGPTGGTTAGTTRTAAYGDNDRLLTENVFGVTGHTADKRSYGYDADGNQTCALSTTGSTTAGAAPTGTGSCGTPSGAADSVTSSYYLDGLVRSVTERHTTGGSSRAVNYSYDGAGAPIGWQQDTSTGTATSTVTHNDAGLPLSQTSSQLGTPTTWRYNNNGQPTQQTNPNGTTQTWTYNASDDLLASTGVTSPGGSGTDLANWTYSHDEQGRILTQTHQTKKPDGSTEPATTYRYRYDAAGRLTRFSNGIANVDSTYDHDSNRLTNGTYTYTYNADDSIANIKNSANTLDLLGKTQAYDADGDLTDDGCSTFTYTGFDQTRTATPDAGASVIDSTCNTSTLSYGYDPLGRQTTRSSTPAGPNPLTPSPTTSSQFYYAGLSTSTLGETSTGGITNTIDYTLAATGGTLALVSTGTGATTQYLIDDGTGSVGLTLTASGSSACVLHYTPNGEAADDNTATPHKPDANPCSNNLGFTLSDKQYRGERRDNQTGTYQLGNRTYNPARAGFTSPDAATATGSSGAGSPLVDPLTANSYSYVNGDPINFIDPTGHVTEEGHYGRQGSANIENDMCDRLCVATQFRFLKLLKEEANAHPVNPFGYAGALVSGAVEGLVIDPINLASDGLTGTYNASADAFCDGPWCLRDVPAPHVPSTPDFGHHTTKTVGKWVPAVVSVGGAAKSLVKKGLEKGATRALEAATAEELASTADQIAAKATGTADAGAASGGTAVHVGARPSAAEAGTAVRGGIGPVSQGTAGVERTVADIEGAGGRILGREVTVESGGVRTRPDLFVELPGGQQAFIEVKSGAFAGLTSNQGAAFPSIMSNGFTPFGANAAGAGLTPGMPYGPIPVWVVRQPWPL